MTTSNIFEYRGYSVTLNFGEENIQLRISRAHVLNDSLYVAVMQQKDFLVQHDLDTIYKVMLSTFTDKDENFKLYISILSGFMKLNFHALVGGFLKVQFEMMLKERVCVTYAVLKEIETVERIHCANHEIELF